VRISTKSAVLLLSDKEDTVLFASTYPTTPTQALLKTTNPTTISETEVIFTSLTSTKKMNHGDNVLNGSLMLAPTSKTPCAQTFALSSTEEVRHHRK
jgi:hypothetical protein